MSTYAVVLRIKKAGKREPARDSQSLTIYNAANYSEAVGRAMSLLVPNFMVLDVVSVKVVSQ